MSAADHLGPQFWSPEKLGATRTSDYPGTVADGVPAMESWQARFGGTGEARPYATGETPEGTVNHYRRMVRNGYDTGSIHVVDWQDDALTPSIKDGHHKAIAYHLEGKDAPVHVHTLEQFMNRSRR